MKNRNRLMLIPMFILMSACSTMQHSEKKVIEEAKLETPIRGSEETQAKIMEILNQDASVVDSERKSIAALIDQGFAKYKDLEVLANQKKILLVREYMNKTPNKNKIHSIQSAIKKTYSQKSDVMMECFDDIAKVMKLHPQSAARFFERAGSFWPMRERSI